MEPSKCFVKPKKSDKYIISTNSLHAHCYVENKNVSNFYQKRVDNKQFRDYLCSRLIKRETSLKPFLILTKGTT